MIGVDDDRQIWHSTTLQEAHSARRDRGRRVKRGKGNQSVSELSFAVLGNGITGITQPVDPGLFGRRRQRATRASPPPPQSRPASFCQRVE